jgi:hypothetical protein
MNTYKYIDFGEEDFEEFEITDDGIISKYWEYWSTRMKEKGFPDSDITKENCIDDFCVVHWAYKI